MQPTGRLYLCANCREQIFICRHCDRGNRYCRDCAQSVRQACVREAGQRYQSSRRGRFAHAERARRYRRRRQEVTHHGSLAAGSNDVLQADLDAAVAVVDVATHTAASSPCCHCCGRPLPAFVRTGYVRRRGSQRRIYRFDHGDLADDDYP